MNSDTINHLLELNQRFYQTFAAQFAATRQRIQPGVRRVITNLASNSSVLDLGCGNGELWRAFQQAGHTGRYIGLDSSLELLQVAIREDPSRLTPSSQLQEGLFNRRPAASPAFYQADLAVPDWHAPLAGLTFDTVLAFAVLHHLPGRTLRLQLLHKIHQLLAPGGYFIHSNWQFLNSPRLRLRIQPWDTVNISEDLLEPQDYLLDWRHGGLGLRYVHHFSEPELAQLALESDFEVVESFYSDGEGKHLALYQIWALRS
ncbi:MAG: class I SAM-dependent methyltransferase [Chloroflexota bacterium]